MSRFLELKWSFITLGLGALFVCSVAAYVAIAIFQEGNGLRDKMGEGNRSSVIEGHKTRRSGDVSDTPISVAPHSRSVTQPAIFESANANVVSAISARHDAVVSDISNEDGVRGPVANAPSERVGHLIEERLGSKMWWKQATEVGGNDFANKNIIASRRLTAEAATDKKTLGWKYDYRRYLVAAKSEKPEDRTRLGLFIGKNNGNASKTSEAAAPEIAVGKTQISSMGMANLQGPSAVDVATISIDRKRVIEELNSKETQN